MQTNILPSAAPTIRGLRDVVADSEKELLIVKKEILSEPLDTPRWMQLYGIQQALEYILNPSIAAPPSTLVVKDTLGD